MDVVLNTWFEIGFVVAAILSGICGYEIHELIQKTPDIAPERVNKIVSNSFVAVAVSFVLGPLSMCYWAGYLIYRGGR